MLGVILAGGKSSRFGSDKASAILAGQPLLQWVIDAVQQVCVEVLIIAARGQSLPAVSCDVPLRVVRDRYLESGPLAGMVTAFEAAPEALCLVVSCDAPLIEPRLLRYLGEVAEGAMAVCPEAGGRAQPLVAVYRAADCLPAFREAVEGGERRVLRAMSSLGTVKLLPEDEVRRFDPGLRSFSGVNTPEELARAASLLEERAPGYPPGQAPG
ncbi:MAG: molybdenum cofactor guanylyltransferase [Dehalococcoidia bacterium]|nr:molybdenum cofactor guanylyltransferase [Dehalococcoidia bacterium]